MRRLILTRKALADLEGIWTYGEEQWGEVQAEAYAAALNAAMRTVAENPLPAVACERVRPGFRRLRCRSHVIYFTMQGEDVRVIRVLHQRMDTLRHL